MISDLIARLVGSSEHDLGILRKSVRSLAARVFGAAMALLFSVVVARSLGASGTGIFFLALAIVTVAGTLARFGMDTAIVKIVGRDFVRQDLAAIHGLYLGSAGSSLLIGFLAAAALWGFAPAVADSVFGQPELAGTLRHLTVAIPFVALLQIQAAFFFGIHRTSTAFSLQNALLPGLALLLMLFALSPKAPETISRIYAWSAFLSCGIGVVLWGSIIGIRGATAGFGHIAELFRLAPPMLFSAFMNRIVTRWISIILLGFWASSSETGQFAAAARLTLLLSFALAAANAVTAPRLAKQFGSGEISQMARTGSVTTSISLLLAAPLFLVFAVFPDRAMSLFGSEFSEAGHLLLILTIGEIVNVLTGPVGSLLQMSKHEREYANCTFLGGLTQLVLCVILIPRFGATGAAIATAIALSLTNLSALAYTYNRLGIIPIPILGARLAVNKIDGSRPDD